MMRQVPFYASDDTQQSLLAVYKSILAYYIHRQMSWDELASFTGYDPVKANTQMTAMGFDIQTTESPELSEIDTLLGEGRLLATRTADGNWLLILDRLENCYVVHDPLAAKPDERIDIETLAQLMGDEVISFKLAERRNLRLDQHVVDQFPLLSRAYATRLIDEGKVLVNGHASKPGYKVRERDTVTIEYDDSQAVDVPAIDLPVLYEDDDCIVINKPSGVLTHTVGKLHGEASVASFIRSRVHNAPAMDAAVVGIRNSKVNQDNLRAGIVHRLDRATSGVIICAKTPQALSWLQKQFHDREAHKIYAAVVTGQMEPSEAIVDMPIERNPKAPATFRVGANGKHAVTAYKTLEVSEKYSLLELRPKTGRTHQLRVHLTHQNHPIVGDYMYNGQTADRLYLHAWKLEITIPDGTSKTFEAPLPTEFATIMKG